MNYNKFLKLIDEIEENINCPYCGGILVNDDPECLSFLCEDCGEIIEFDENKNIIPDEE